MTPIDSFTDEQLAAMAQVDIASIISGETPVTGSTPLIACDPETGRPIVVTAFELGQSMLENAASLGAGSPACAVRSQRAIDLLTAIGYPTYNPGARKRRLRAVSS